MDRSLFIKSLLREAGVIADGYFKKSKNLRSEEKNSAHDVVTIADKSVEKFIAESLQSAFLDDGILGEETGFQNGKNDSIWVVDPIDGTENFVRGIACYCISVAYVEKNIVRIGAVYDPVFDELFYAEEGQGAYVNDRKLLTANDSWESAVIGLGRSERYETETYWQNIPRLLNSGAEYRKLGSAALSLAYVAEGRLSAYYEPHLYPWDALGGLLLAQEAGASTNMAEYMTGNWNKGAPVIAATQSIHIKLTEILKKGSDKKLVGGHYD